MPTRICEICNKEFGSGASYRTHKSVYHRPVPQSEATEVIGEQKPDNSTAESKHDYKHEPDPNPEKKDDDQEGKGDDGWGWLLAAGGAAVAIILIILSGGKKGQA